MKISTIYLPLALILLFFSCKDQQIIAETRIEDESIIQLSLEQFEHAKMQLGSVQLHEFSTEITLNGHTEVPPHNKATISTYYGGYISYSPYLVGDSVKKGQVLIKMKNPDFIELQENYIKAYEQYLYLSVDFKRQDQLHQKLVIADKDFQMITKEYKSALADVQSLGAQLELLNINLEALQNGSISSEISILSPIDGQISEVELNLGAYIPAQSEMMSIVNTTDIHLELDVFEKDLEYLSKGQQIEFKTVGNDHVYGAQLELIGSEIEEEHRTVMVHADLNEPYFLIPGLFVNAVVHTKPENLLALAREAFISADDQYYLLVLEEQTDSYYRFRKYPVDIIRADKTHYAFDVTDFKDKEFLISGGFQLF